MGSRRESAAREQDTHIATTADHGRVGLSFDHAHLVAPRRVLNHDDPRPVDLISFDKRHARGHSSRGNSPTANFDRPCAAPPSPGSQPHPNPQHPAARALPSIDTTGGSPSSAGLDIRQRLGGRTDEAMGGGNGWSAELGGGALRSVLAAPDAAPAPTAPQFTPSGTGFAAPPQVGPSRQNTCHEGSHAFSHLQSGPVWSARLAEHRGAPLPLSSQSLRSTRLINGRACVYDGRAAAAKRAPFSLPSLNVIPANSMGGQTTWPVVSKCQPRGSLERSATFGAPRIRAEIHLPLGRKFTPNGRAAVPWSRPAMGGRVVFSERFGFIRRRHYFWGSSWL
jgi:hypothetical protein